MNKQPELHIGAVIDGDIVAGQHEGQWLLVAPASKRIIAKWGVCPDGYDLPTVEELDMIWCNCEAIDAVDMSGGGGLLGEIAASGDRENGWGCVWSSTEYSSNNAWFHRFSGGGQFNNSKNSEHWVVPVRRISTLPETVESEPDDEADAFADGGPAFPSDSLSCHPGMTLRDYFAVRALGYCGSYGTPDELAQAAYRLADAMLKARGGAE
jgi:hypothetical protein